MGVLWLSRHLGAGLCGTDDTLACAENVPGVVRQIKEAGMKVGLAVKPKTDIRVVEEYIDEVDMILVMTVEPGFGGQKFMADMMPKVCCLDSYPTWPTWCLRYAVWARLTSSHTQVEHLRRKYRTLNIEVDGGLGEATIEAAATAGANWIVAGSSVFKCVAKHLACWLPGN